MKKISDLAKAFEKDSELFTESSKKIVNSAYNQIDQFSQARLKESENTILKDMRNLELLINKKTGKIGKIITSKTLNMIFGALILSGLLMASLYGLISYKSKELASLYETEKALQARHKSIRELIELEGKKTKGVGISAKGEDIYITIPVNKKLRFMEKNEAMKFFIVIDQEG